MHAAWLESERGSGSTAVSLRACGRGRSARPAVPAALSPYRGCPPPESTSILKAGLWDVRSPDFLALNHQLRLDTCLLVFSLNF